MPAHKHPLRLYVRQTLKAGQEADFLKGVGSLVETVKKQPGTLQYEWFYNGATGRVVTLESHVDAAGLVAHLTNAKKAPLLQQLAPLGTTDVICAFGPLPRKMVTGLKKAGLPLRLTVPWPGTLRLNEAGPGEPEVQSYVEMELSDVEAYRRASARIEAAAARWPGVLHHQSFVLDSPRIAVLEGYANQEALLAWGTRGFAAAAGDLSPLITGITVELFGELNGKARALMDAWGATYFRRLAGFSRFNQLR